VTAQSAEQGPDAGLFDAAAAAGALDMLLSDASMVNPPGNPKSTFQTGPRDDNPADPADWLRAAQTVPGSWWPDYSAWLGERSGARQARPGRLGNASYPPLQAAPGSYVLDR
jgi:poly(3-hydroxyalkanoate) synthetase